MLRSGTRPALPMLLPTRTARDLRRTREIVRVLVRHGLGELAQRLGASWLPRFGRRPAAAVNGTPARVRAALEDLGPAFVKLGQTLAGRSDLLPVEWTTEFARLREHVRPVPWSALAEQLTQDLGAPPETLFRDLDPVPLAAGSIAQIHRASLADGTPVVLKIRRPGIREVVEDDLRLLEKFVGHLEREPALAGLEPRRVVRELARAITGELDLRIEGQNAAAFARNLAHRTDVVVPRVHAQWTHERLLVLDFVDGTSAAQWLAGARPPGMDPARIARLGAEVVLEMIFEHGLYHSDPHAGNVMFLPGNRIGLLDFGQVGRLGRERRAELERLLAAGVEQDEEAVVDVLSGWTTGRVKDIDGLRNDTLGFIERWRDVRLAELDVGRMLLDVTSIARANELVLPADAALLIKTFVTLEGFGRELDPSFRLSSLVEPWIRRTVGAQRSPLARLRRGLSAASQAAVELPSALAQLAASLRRGRFALDVDLERLDHFGRQVDRSANRMTMGVVTAALIVGTAIAMTVKGGPELFGLPFFGMLGFVSSSAVGIVLLVSIARSRAP